MTGLHCLHPNPLARVRIAAILESPNPEKKPIMKDIEKVPVAVAVAVVPLALQVGNVDGKQV